MVREIGNTPMSTCVGNFLPLTIPQGLHFNVTDPLGTRRVQASGTGQVEQNCKSLPFGDSDSCFALGTLTSPTEHLFTGKERDTESGLDYFGARYYGSSMGRFTSPDDGSDFDPSDPQSWNLYTYVRNNPIRNVDPDGRDCVTQVKTGSNTETATATTGGCSGVAGNGTTQTYVSGTVTSLKLGADGKSIDIGSNNVDGSSTVTNANLAPAPDNPGIALGYNQAGFAQLNNTGKVVGYGAGIGLAVINGLLDGGVLNSTMPETGMLSGVGNPAVKINWMHNLLNPRAGHLPPPGSAEVVQGAVEGAIKAGQYSTDANGVIHGTVQILGKSCGFDGKVVNGVVRVSTVYGKF